MYLNILPKMTIIQAVLLSLFTTVSGGLVGFWLGIFKERHSQYFTKTLGEKSEILPVVEMLIKNIEVHHAPVLLWDEAMKLEENYRRLKIVVRGRKLKRLNETWEELSNIKRNELWIMEVEGGFLDSPDVVKASIDIKQVRTLLESRMNAFKKAVEML